MKISITCFLLSFLFCLSACQQGRMGNKSEIGVKEVPDSFSYLQYGEIIGMEYLTKVGSLSGRVLGPGGDPKERVLVERMNEEWEKREEATFTNSKGKFQLPDVGPGTYFLQISYPTLTVINIKIEVVEGSREDIEIELNLSM